VGDSFQARIAPEQGYGVRHEAMVQEVERSRFPEGAQIHPGVQFQAHTQQGPHVVTVVKVEGDAVTIDGNHPLAGMTLHFDVKVLEVRAATEEELAHGHVHGAGGHAH